MQLAAIGVIGTVALMMAAGTVVTGTGPLAGAADVARYHLPLGGVTQLHADIGWLLGRPDGRAAARAPPDRSAAAGSPARLAAARR